MRILANKIIRIMLRSSLRTGLRGNRSSHDYSQEMVIVLANFHLIAFLFCLIFLRYSHGMEQEQKSTEQMQKITSFKLRADAVPFIPQSIQIARQISQLPDDLYDTYESYGDNLGSKDENSSVQSQKSILQSDDRASGKSRDSRDSETHNEMVDLRQAAEFPFISNSNQAETPDMREILLHQPKQQQEYIAASPSTTIVEEKLNDDDISDKMTALTSEKKKPSKAPKPKAIAIHEVKKKKQEHSPPEKYGVRQGAISPTKKTEDKPSKIPPPRGSSPVRSSGAAIVKKKNKTEIPVADSTHKNRFNVLQTDDENDNEEKDSSVQLNSPTSLAALPISGPPLSSSGVSRRSKDKAVMTDKMIEKEERLERFHSRVNSIVYSIEKLEQNKAECMKIPFVNEQMKVENLFELMNAYLKIMDDLDTFSAIYRVGEMIKPAYIGELFDFMNKAYEASMVDAKILTRTMEKTLTYLVENLQDILNLDDIFKNIDHMDKYIVLYDQDRNEDTKAEMILWYTNNVEGKIRYMLHYLFVGLYSKGAPNLNVRLDRNSIYAGFSAFNTVIKSRKEEFLEAKLTMDTYMEFVQQEAENDNQEETNANRTVKEHNVGAESILPKHIQELNTNTESNVGAIIALQDVYEMGLKTSEPKERMNLKEKLKEDYLNIMMSLTNFVGVYGKNDDKPSDFFEDVIVWMMKKYKGAWKVYARDLVATMQFCLDFLQEDNKRGEDMIKIGKLLHNIDYLKTEADKCEEFAKSGGGYKDEAKRAKLDKVVYFYLYEIKPQLRETFGYVYIGMGNETDEPVPLSMRNVKNGLIALKSVALPEYKEQLGNAKNMITEFYCFRCKSSVQEIGANLTEYVAKILGINFDPDNDDNMDTLAEKIEFPPAYKVYKDGLAAIGELLEAEEKKKSSNVSSASSSKAAAGSSKGKQKSVKKNKKAGKPHDFGPVDADGSNWEVVLNEAKKMIRYVCILVQIEKEWGKSERIFELAIYLRTWTILFQNELYPTVDKWETTYYTMRKINPVKREVNMSTIIKFYSDGIFNFIEEQRKGNKDNRGKKIHEALKHLNQLQVDYLMFHHVQHLRKWLSPDEKLDEKLICNCKEFAYLRKD